MHIDQAGSYRAKVTSKDLGFTSTGKEQVAVGFEVTDGGPQQGHTATWYGFFSEKALPFAIKTLRVLGWTGADLADMSSVGSSGEVEIVVREEEYQGQVQHKIAFVNAIGGGGMALKSAMDDAQKRAFAARMRALVLGIDPSAAQVAAKPAAPVSRAPSGPPEPPPLDDRDIPF